MGNSSLEANELEKIISKSHKKIALLDANCFYVSCERLFNPKMKKRPTVVLSNNDGCIIARSPEVKEMGIKMGQPLFKLDKDVEKNLIKFSSNYHLYGDISDRIANILKKYTKSLEVYSIDESFMDLSHIPTEKLNEFCLSIKTEIWRLTGIPISIGIGPNKTLAKLCNHIAKSKQDFGGVCSYWEIDNIDGIDVDEVWGIGSKWKQKLTLLNVSKIGEFKSLLSAQIKKMFTVVGLRTWMELHEYLVHDIETEFKKPKVVTSSRSFGRTVWQKDQVLDSIWTFLEDATEKLKLEELKAKSISLFVTTDRFEENYFVWSKKYRLYNPTNDISQIWNEIVRLFDDLPTRLWAKAGVIFYHLVPDELEEPRIFTETFEEVERPKISQQSWLTRRDYLSPKLTTDWNDIPKIH
jgi:DNA polymerase V